MCTALYLLVIIFSGLRPRRRNSHLKRALRESSASEMDEGNKKIKLDPDYTPRKGMRMEKEIEMHLASIKRLSNLNLILQEKLHASEVKVIDLTGENESLKKKISVLSKGNFTNNFPSKEFFQLKIFYSCITTSYLLFILFQTECASVGLVESKPVSRTLDFSNTMPAVSISKNVDKTNRAEGKAKIVEQAKTAGEGKKVEQARNEAKAKAVEEVPRGTNLKADDQVKAKANQPSIPETLQGTFLFIF